jgi:hypothetical protein
MRIVQVQYLTRRRGNGDRNTPPRNLLYHAKPLSGRRKRGIRRRGEALGIDPPIPVSMSLPSEMQYRVEQEEQEQADAHNSESGIEEGRYCRDHWLVALGGSLALLDLVSEENSAAAGRKK